MSSDELTQAAALQRRWRGLGSVLLVTFYSFYFAAHLSMMGTAVYLKDHAVVGAKTASFFAALSGHGAATEQGVSSAFLLLHRPLVSMLTAAWAPFSGTEAIAAKHAVATLTAGAGALVVVLLYEALLWSGVQRWRACGFAAVLGTSAAMTLLSVLPQPQIFSTLGLMAAMTALVRGRSAHWWEFGGAAVYSCCCSFFNIIPILLLMAVRGVRLWWAGGGWRCFTSMLTSMCLLLLLSFGAVHLQERVYPDTRAEGGRGLRERVCNTWNETLVRSTAAPWGERFSEGFVGSLRVSGHGSVVIEGDSGRRDRRYVVPEASMALLDVWDGGRAVWLGLLLLSFYGWLRSAMTRGAMFGGVALVAWSIWFYGSLEGADEQLLWPVLWTPTLVLLVAAGVEGAVRRQRLLWIPALAAIVLLAAVQGWHHQQWIAHIAQLVSL